MNKPQPPKYIPYPQYTEQQKQDALLAVIRYVWAIPESRLRQPEAQEKTKLAVNSQTAD